MDTLNIIAQNEYYQSIAVIVQALILLIGAVLQIRRK